MPDPAHFRSLAAILLAVSAAAAAQTNSVNGVRFWSFSDTTRVVIETSDEFEYRTDRVQNPDRVFYDVLGARTRLSRRGQHTIRVNDPRLRQIRVAETQPGVTRIVFDVEPGIEAVASQLTNPSRLIIELRPLAVAATVDPPMPSAPPLPKQTPRVDTLPDPSPAKLSSTTVAAKLDPPMPAAPQLPKQTTRVDTISDPTRTREKVAAVAALGPPKPARISAGQSSLTRVLGLKVGRIVIDAGHGGHDVGTVGPGGLYEKDLVLDVAKRLGELVSERMGAEVVYTRGDDTFIPLETRTVIANQKKADLFLSIHANSSPERSSSGVETYYLNFTSSPDAMEVAARENASSHKSVYELKDLLQKIARQEKIDESREFAGRIQQALYTAASKGNSRTRNRGVKKAPFVVLIGADMPSVLAEIGFVSNPRDEALFKKPEFRQRIAEGLYKGLSGYAGTLSQFNVAKN